MCREASESPGPGLLSPARLKSINNTVYSNMAFSKHGIMPIGYKTHPCAVRPIGASRYFTLKQPYEPPAETVEAVGAFRFFGELLPHHILLGHRALRGERFVSPLLCSAPTSVLCLLSNISHAYEASFVFKWKTSMKLASGRARMTLFVPHPFIP